MNKKARTRQGGWAGSWGCSLDTENASELVYGLDTDKVSIKGNTYLSTSAEKCYLVIPCLLSPGLCCSNGCPGEQTNRCPKPDRTRRPSVKLVTLWNPKGAKYWKGDPSTLACQVVERAEGMTKRGVL